MSTLARVVVIVAALLVALNGAFDLLDRMNFHFGKLGAKENADDNSMAPRGVPVKKGESYIAANPVDFEIEYRTNRDDAEPPQTIPLRVLIPMRTEAKGSPRNWRTDNDAANSFLGASRDPAVGLPVYSNGFPVWGCQSTAATSLIVFDYASAQSRQAMPDGAVATSFILPYGRLGQSEQDDGRVVVGTYVTDDSNKDGILNCNDAEKLFFFNTKYLEFKSLDVGGQPFFTSPRFLYPADAGADFLISVGLDENGDGVFDPYTESVVPKLVNFMSLEVKSIPLE